VFAEGLVAGLAAAGIPAALFHVDDFRRPLDWTRTDRSEADLYFDEYYDLGLIERCVLAFNARAPEIDIPIFDSVTERLVGRRRLALAGADLAVVEGIFALRIPAAARGLVIYIEAGEEEARRRILERDLQKGRSREVIEHRLMARYLPGQRRYQAAFHPRERADVVIDNDTLGSPRVRKRQLDEVLPEALRAALDRLLPPISP
jgi:uridine kinase